MKTLHLTLITAIVTLLFSSCDPETAEAQDQNNGNLENVETFSPYNDTKNWRPRR